MTAYWLTIYSEISDPARVAAYAKLAGPAIAAGGGSIISRGLPAHTYEAGTATHTVLIEFNSVEAARAAHDSVEYQNALTALDNGAIRDVRIISAL